jgi:hypothetical protein
MAGVVREREYSRYARQMEHYAKEDISNIFRIFVCYIN